MSRRVLTDTQAVAYIYFWCFGAPLQTISTSSSRTDSRKISSWFVVCATVNELSISQLDFRPRNSSLGELCCICLFLKNGSLITHLTHKSSRSFMDPVSYPEKIARRRVIGTSTVPAQLSASDNHPLERDEKTRSVEEQMMELLQKEEIEYDRRCSRSGLQTQSQARGDAVISPREVYSIVEALLQKSIEKLDDRVMNIAERAMIDALKTCKSITIKPLSRKRSALFTAS